LDIGHTVHTVGSERKRKACLNYVKSTADFFQNPQVIQKVMLFDILDTFILLLHYCSDNTLYFECFYPSAIKYNYIENKCKEYYNYVVKMSEAMIKNKCKRNVFP